MKVAYWPGCVSRGFTPELHGSMAKVAPLLDIELVPLDRACCTGAGVIAEHNQELADLRVGPFYGCYIVRPVDRLGIDNELPRDTYLGQVIEALGGTVIEYAGSHKCCGFPIITMNKEASLKQAGRHLGDAKDADADCLVTPCPLCHLNLDLQQPLAERVVGRDLEMPILHLPQLVGLALGLEPKELGLQRHVVKPTAVIDWLTSVVAGVEAAA